MDEKNLTAQEYNQLTKVSLENIDYSKVDWDAELERHYEEIVDKMVEMCVKMFNERHIKTLDDVYGNTNCLDCGELPSVLFSNIDKLALLREGVAYYDGAVESRLTEYEMDVVIDECMKNLSSEEVDVINARRREELSMGFDFENEIRTRMIMYGNYLELAEIANIFAHQGIIEALAYKYENTSAKDMIPFHADNYLHTKYLTFGDALRDYIDFCAGYFSDWDDDDERRAVHRFLDYWRMEKLNQEDVRGNYG